MSFKDTYTIRCAACRTKNRIPQAKVDQKAKCGKCGVQLEIEALREERPVMVGEADFETRVLKSPLPVLLYCWAAWCGTCKTTMPIIDELAKDSKGRIRVAKLNVDQNPALAAKYNILSLPYMLVFDNGQMADNFPGVLAKHEMMMKMAKYI